jgi:hypothetical protein
LLYIKPSFTYALYTTISHTMYAKASFRNEKFVSRRNTYADICAEYAHNCVMEYKVERPVCPHCLNRLETNALRSTLSQNMKSSSECTCCEYTSFVLEHCNRCSSIKEEVQFLRNEIRRTSLNYGLEVAETLEINPLFEQSIEKLVLRIQMLEQVLLRQQIDNATEREHLSSSELDDDDISQISIQTMDDELSISENAYADEEHSRDCERYLDLQGVQLDDISHIKPYINIHIPNVEACTPLSDNISVSVSDVNTYDEDERVEQLDGVTASLQRIAITRDDAEEQSSTESGHKRKREETDEILYDV